MRVGVLLTVIALLGIGPLHAAKKTRKPATHRAAKQALTADAVNAPSRETVRAGSAGPVVMRAQILLDRAHFSPGEIDSRYGDNLRVAIEGYRANHHLPPSRDVDVSMWTQLDSDSAPPVVEHTLTAKEVEGPFQKVPADMMEQAKLDRLGYSSVQEKLGERFHVNPKVLEELNPGKDLAKEGETILVPNVERGAVKPAGHVEVSKDRRTVTAFDASGEVLAQYPATIGSEHDPLPIGDWKVTIVQENPLFNYNPELFWDAKATQSKATIQPGPNNPVGLVWIGLTKEHYGIHGTPEPGLIGHAESHGCVRLTNWDALELAGMVKRNTPVLMREE